MTDRPRYRVEDGRSCIDIKVRQARQLFDSRDPAPFRERDLDQNALEYLLEAAQEIPRGRPLKIVVTIAEPGEPPLAADVLTEAIRTHFAYLSEQLTRRLADHNRRGRRFLAVGVTALAVFLTLAELTRTLPVSTFRDILREGLVITGWVAMWRPLEVLLYDWRPLVDERRQVERLLDAPIDVRSAD
ncbi:MAG: hypothetical protein AB7I25_11790 [Vicinamibacterales bacterium]